MRVIETMPDEVADTFVSMEQGIVALAPDNLKTMVIKAFDWADNAKKEIEQGKAPKSEKSQVIKMLDKFQKDLNKYYDEITKQKNKSNAATTKRKGESDGIKESAKKTAELESEKQKEITEISKPDINLSFIKKSDLGNLPKKTRDSILNEQKEILEKFKLLKSLVNCK
jgi:hypothetical protein